MDSWVISLTLYALDFDGVFCDSYGESSLSAFKIYPGVPDVLKCSNSKLYIVTTKQMLCFESLLELLGIYGLRTG